MTRAVIYARFSCDKQRDASIDDQLYECSRYAEQHSYDVVGQYCDYAMSGRSDDRPQFLRMIEDAQSGIFDVILLWKIDRFARNMQDQYYYEHILGKCGVVIESCRENISGTSIEATTNKAMTALFAQMRSITSAEDTMRGMIGKARKCEYLGVNLFGYSHDGDTITLDPVRAPLAREIHTRYLEGQRVDDIAEWLNVQGIRNKNGKPVTRNFVYGILANPRYAGIYIWGKRKDDNGNVMLDEWGDPIPLVYVEDGMPAIVPRDLKESVIERLKHGKKRRAIPEDYVLSGKLYCSECGNNMHGIMVRNEYDTVYRYYACKHKRRCCHGTMRREALEAMIAEGVREVFSDSELCKRLAKRYVQWQGLKETTATRKALDAERRDVVRRRERVINAVADGMPWADAKPRVDSLDLQIASIDKQIEELDRRQSGFTEDEVRDFFSAIAQNEAASDDEILRSFVSRVWLFPEKAVATLSFTGKSYKKYEVELALDDKRPDGERVRLSRHWCTKGHQGRTVEPTSVILLHAGIGVVVPLKIAC